MKGTCIALIVLALCVGYVTDNFGKGWSSSPPLICTDTIREQAFHSVKNGIEYCFYRKTNYPYRISGGIIGVD